MKGIVVISRNVDVLVSKLRKKLSDDSSIKFINVHGKGYKFVIEKVLLITRSEVQKQIVFYDDCFVNRK